jgi:transposase-like protein
METIENKTYAFYFILIRKPNDTAATISRPYVSEGIESGPGWQEAFSKLPATTFSSIKVIVCDGHRGLTSLAKRSDWLIQRCQFHLLASLQGRRSKSAKSRHQKIGESLFQLAGFIMNSLDEKEIKKRIGKLKVIRKNSNSRVLRKIISGFVKHYQDFQTYLFYPDLKLPRTSNAAESLIGSVRNMIYRAHGFRTIKSFKFKVFAFLKHKRKITCNGFHQPN